RLRHLVRHHRGDHRGGPTRWLQRLLVPGDLGPRLGFHQCLQLGVSVREPFHRLDGPATPFVGDALPDPAAAATGEVPPHAVSGPTAPPHSHQHGPRVGTGKPFLLVHGITPSRARRREPSNRGRGGRGHGGVTASRRRPRLLPGRPRGSAIGRGRGGRTGV